MVDGSEGVVESDGGDLLGALADGVLVLDADSGTVLEANEAARDLFDADSALSGRQLRALVDGGSGTPARAGESHRVVWTVETDAASDGTDGGAAGTPAAGTDLEARYIEATLNRTNFDGRTAVVATLRDASARIARERSLEQHERVVATMPDGVFVIDETGRMVGGNAAMAEMIGEDMAGLKGKPFADLVADGILEADVLETYAAVVDRLLDGSGRETVEIEVTPPGETARTYECHVTLRPPDAGPFTGIIGVTRDVTERAATQAELRRQNERLEGFASVVSHDLRNPLNVVRGRLDLYRERDDEDHLDRAERAVERTERIVTDLLTLARQGETVGETESVGLAAVAREAWDYVETPDATLTVTGGSRVEADPDRLSGMLENLFRNAVEHGGEGVTVTVGSLGEAGAPVGFHVTDDGTGIDPTVRDSLFEEGVTSSREGTGLGLSIVERVAEAHGWSVSAGENEAGGARFEVWF
jgi:PAS domain S-box-containing protein